MKKLNFTTLVAIILATSGGWLLVPQTAYAALTLEATASGTSDTNLTTFTFSGVSLGTDVSGSDKRYTVVGFGASNPNGVTFVSASVGGVPATLVSQDGISAKIESNVDILMALYVLETTGVGATADISVTLSASPDRMAYQVWRMINPLSMVPVDTAVNNTNSSGVTSLSLEIPRGGAAIGLGVIRNNEATTAGWTNLSIDSDQTFAEATNGHVSGAHGGSVGGPAAITFTSTDTSVTGMGAVAASWAEIPSRTFRLFSNIPFKLNGGRFILHGSGQ